ncbi:hypothetical protein KAI87_10155, partial [Myxococcota bacterium]|nr:hypothetical protein [Myxococcota bacterium]
PLSNGADEGCPYLSDLGSLDFSVDARLLFDHQNKEAGYDDSKHAADYLMYFTIQTRNAAQADGYGDFLWFGLTVYGDRDASPGLYVAGDDFSGKLIYNIGYEPLCETDLTDGAWHNLKEDLLPHILLAVQEAWDRGYLPDSHNLADYRIGGMNLGWEVPGLNDAELQIRNLSLIYTDYSASEVRYDFNTNGNTEGWTASNVNELNGGPIDGRWLMTVPGSDPMWLSPTLQINAAAYSSISVTMANNGNPVDDSHMQIFWLVSGAANFSETNSAWIRDISNTGGWATYTLDLSEEENWSGLITQIRIDPIESGNDSTIGVDSIVLTP